MNKFNITDLSIEEVNLLVSGLLELPGKFTINLIAKLKNQLEEQGVNTRQDQPLPPPQGPLSDKVVN